MELFGFLFTHFIINIQKYDSEAKRPEHNLHRIKEIEEALNKILSKPLETTPPVFVFEEKIIWTKLAKDEWPESWVI